MNSFVDVRTREATPDFLRAVDELAEVALQRNAKYIEEQLELFEQRKIWRSLARQPVTAWCGWGRSGKDEAGDWLGKHTGLIYPGGGCSLVALPLVGSVMDVSLEECWATRHECRLFWFHFLNACREKSFQTLLVTLVLARGDMVTGIRSFKELRAAVDARLVDRTIWIHRANIPVDTTVEYDELDCHHVIINSGTLSEYHAKLRRFCQQTLGFSIKEQPHG